MGDHSFSGLPGKIENMVDHILPQKSAILGVGVNPINLAIAINAIRNWITIRSPHYVCVAPAHSIMQGYRDPTFRKILIQSGFTTPDGMAIVWLLRLQRFPQTDRVYGPDLMRAVYQQSISTGW